MNSRKIVSILFWVAGIYDGLLGLAFIIFGRSVFEMSNIAPPNHIGYIQFPAALLIIFGLMFIAIAKDPVGRWHMIAYGILLKLSYCTIIFSHWIISGIPWIWKPFAICDALFIVTFIWAMMAIKQK